MQEVTPNSTATKDCLNPVCECACVRVVTPVWFHIHDAITLHNTYQYLAVRYNSYSAVSTNFSSPSNLLRIMIKKIP